MKTATTSADGQHEGEICSCHGGSCRLLYFLVPLELLMLLVLLDIIINLIFLVHVVPFGL